MASLRRKHWLFFAVVAGILLFCQLTSYWINQELLIGKSQKIFSFLHFTHVRNQGGIFGIFQGKGWLFAAVSVLFIGILIMFLLRSKSVRTYEYIFYGFIVGGGLSNITDRLIYGSVVDFIDVRGIAFWHYIFNTADLMIHLGVWPLVLMYMLPQRGKEPELSDSEVASS